MSVTKVGRVSVLIEAGAMAVLEEFQAETGLDQVAAWALLASVLSNELETGLAERLRNAVTWLRARQKVPAGSRFAIRGKRARARRAA